ncbi:hypothetical protein V7S43_013027 [Phytophthora oleae]|uniref:RxLR effector PexRD54 WY domain-containing protein n=1 Tax=Phytophthora oleae TaxID=2107226 RepID=A0ABD3F9K2_9STRA
MAFKSSLCTKVLVLVALLVCINVATAVSTSKTVSAQPLELNDAAATQFLRSEERKLAVTVPGLEQAVTSKSWLSKLASKIKSMFSGKKTPADMFTKMKLDKEGGLLFYGSKFTKWTDYVRKNAKGDADLAIFSTLATHYSDDALAKMLHSAKKVGSTKELATKLETMQTTNWVYQKASPSKVFKTLELDQAGAKVFKNPQFSRWTDYVTKTNPKNPDVAIYIGLGTHYSDEALAKMFTAAKKVESSKPLATKLEGIQLQNWANADDSAQKVFKSLKLDKTGDKLFESPVVGTWASYVTKTQKDPDAVMVALLKESYGDVALAKLIASASKADDTEKLITGLRTSQFQSWKDLGRTPEHINTLLKLNANSDDLTKSIMKQYVKFYGKVKVD